jgi:sRNA-binding carbon storage regulator CsrA
MLERNLTGIRIGQSTQKTAVVAYADDVKIFVTAPKDINVIRDLLLNYERATGACLKIRKSKAMTAGSWITSVNVFDIPYCP